MSNEQVNVRIDNGRIVQGHPMVWRDVLDDNNKPQVGTDGQKVQQVFFSFAVPKKGETHWKETDWGSQIWAVGAESWANGETQRPDFSWKIEDGDSQVPNKNGKKPCDNEGFPGNWIIKLSTRLATPQCFPVGKYDPIQDQFKEPGAIKTGDYGHVLFSVKSNKPAKSPGVYLNPFIFVLTNQGEAIVTVSGPSAASAFADTTASGSAAPPVAPAAPQAAPSAPTVQPAHDLVGGQPPAAPAAPPVPPAAPAPEQFSVQGQVFTRDALKAAGWQDAQIDALPRA